MTDGSNDPPAFRAGGAIPEAAGSPLVLVEGQAARVRTLRDGRRQILSLILPGELLRPADTADGGDELLWLDEGHARELTREELFEVYPKMLLDHLRWAENHIARIGRMTALERLAHLFLELAARSRRADLVGSPIPLHVTQEMLGDVLGLTSVHVNRVLQQLRATNALSFERRELRIKDVAALQRMVPEMPR